MVGLKYSVSGAKGQLDCKALAMLKNLSGSCMTFDPMRRRLNFLLPQEEENKIHTVLKKSKRIIS